MPCWSLAGRIVLGIVGLLGSAALVGAQPPAPATRDEMAKREFDRRDRDDDGYLTAGEAPDGIRNALPRWDTNLDGKINLLEFKRYLFVQARERLARETQRWGSVAAGVGPEFERMAVEEFQKRDRDRNGFLARDQTPGSLRDAWARWETSRDGQIDLGEWKNYLRGRAKQRLSEEALRVKESAEWAVPVVELEAVEAGAWPTVYRAGNLPDDVPSWFPEMDANRDAQVSLAEWIRGGKPAGEFPEMDRNDDGLLTVAELLRRVRFEALVASEEGGILLPLELWEVP